MADFQGGLIKPHYQTGYVTSSLDRALSEFESVYGVQEWKRREPREFQTLSGEPYTIALALGFVGETCIELIEPMGGADGFYQHVLPEDGSFAIRHHHYASLVHSEEEWAELEKTVAATGIKPMWRIDVGSVRALYIDTYDRLGHYIEYLFYKNSKM